MVPWRHPLSRSIRSLLFFFFFRLLASAAWPILVDKQITLPHIVNMIDSFRFRTPFTGVRNEDGPFSLAELEMLVDEMERREMNECDEKDEGRSFMRDDAR